jgi:putative nucleotidyltransferase with HDIG domain|tara:strand:+ start:207 stop:776 length:570 start_codon:yes stop_codon:yes gene_type:complete
MPDRNDAVALVEEWVENDGLRKHMYSVEAALRHYARMRGEDEDLWGMAGLLHDLDWEKYPDRHPLTAVEHLREAGYPEEILQAILAHRADYTGVKPTTDLQKHLVACDELSGLVFATCLVRPSGIDDLKPKSVTKKLKDKGFAAGVSRDEVQNGIELLGLDRVEHIQNVIDGLRVAAAELGIRGEDVSG